MKPTPGRIVEYTLTEQDAARINQLRQQSPSTHFGNQVSAGETYPLMITRTWGSTETSAVNGQVLLDGNDNLWVTSVTQGEGERKFREYARVI